MVFQPSRHAEEKKKERTSNEVRRPPYWQAIVTVATLSCSKATVDFLAIIPSLKMCQMKANTTDMLKPGTPAEHPENLAVGTYVK